MFRRLSRIALCAVVATATYSFAATPAHAEGPLEGLVGGVLNATGSTVEDLTHSTGLNQVIDPRISSSNGAVEVTVTVPAANTQAQATVGGNALATVDASVAPAGGALLDADVHSEVGAPGQLANVEVQAAVAGGEVLDTSFGATVAGENGLIDVTTSASVADGQLADVHADATVGGDSLVDVSVDVDALGNELPGTDVVIEVPGPGTTVPDPVLPVPENPTAPGSNPAPTTPPVVPGANDVPAVDAPTLVPTFIADAAAEMPAQQPATSTTTVVTPPATEMPAPDSTTTLVTTPSTQLATSLLAPALQALNQGGVATLPTIAPATVPVIAAAGLANGFGGATTGLVSLGGAAVTALTAPHSTYNAPLAMLAAFALLGAALLIIAGERDRFGLPVSRTYLPAVPPG